MQTFWYVYKTGVNGGAPRYKHVSYNSAVDEAKRLVDTVGGEYEILEAKAVVKAAPTHLVEPFITPTGLDDSYIPF